MRYHVEERVFSSREDLQVYLNDIIKVTWKLVSILPIQANFSTMRQRFKVGVCIVWEIPGAK